MQKYIIKMISKNMPAIQGYYGRDINQPTILPFAKCFDTEREARAFAKFDLSDWDTKVGMIPVSIPAGAKERNREMDFIIGLFMAVAFVATFFSGFYYGKDSVQNKNDICLEWMKQDKTALQQCYSDLRDCENAINHGEPSYLKVCEEICAQIVC